MANDAWQESALSWANKPPSTDVLATWLPEEGAAIQISVPGPAEDALWTDGLLSLRLHATHATADGLVYYGAREGAAENAPRLSVTSIGPMLSAARSFWVAVNTPAPPSMSAAGFGDNGQFRMMISGDPGVDFIVEASTNLADWTALATNSLPAVSHEIADTAASNHPARFYRTLMAN